jgi:diaminopimelate decarboxylase
MSFHDVKDRFEWLESGQATFDGHDLATLAKTYPTPFYLFSERQLRDNLQQLRRGFAGVDDFRIYYSIKSNYESLVLCTFAQEGIGAELSGALDLELAHRAGFQPEDIVYDSPYKPPEVIEAVLRCGIHLIHIDSLTEARHINDIARRMGRKVNVGIRVDPLLSKPYYDKLIRTYRKKFGVLLDEVLTIGTEIARMPYLNLTGLMSHIGSQIFTPRRHVLTLERLFDVAVALRGRGVNIEEINLGGGYPAHSMRNIRLNRRFVVAQIMEYFDRVDAQTCTIEDFGGAIAESYNSFVQRTGLKPRLTIEPGRCLVANACVVVGRMVVVKNGWIFTDVSINDLPESLFFSEWRLAFPGQPPSTEGRKYNIAGPTLLTQDVLFFQRPVPHPREDAPLVILDTGAYSICRASQFTRPRIACYGITDGGICTVRRAETVGDVLRTQVWPETPEITESEEQDPVLYATD